MSDSELRLVGIAIAALGLAAFIYAAFLANPPIIDLSKLTGIIEKEEVKSQKMDELLLQKFNLNPRQKVRVFVSGVNASDLEKQGFKLIKAGKYADWVVIEGDYEAVNKLLEENPQVQKVIYDKRVRAIGITDTLSELPIKPVIQDYNWNIEAIKADAAHKYDYRGEGAVVAVLDTGVNHNLEALSHGYLGGYDFPYGDSEPDDIYGHGTECTSIILANGTVIGVAPSASYYAVKVLNDNGEGNWSDVAAGLEWVLDKVNSGESIDVVTMSLGAEIAPPEIGELCGLLYDKGVILVAASGNSGSKTSLYPAAYDTVISVAAVDVYGHVATFSNGGAYVAAPGVQIPVLSTDGYVYMGDGTSYATPHVAGVLLLVEAEKDLTPQQAFNLLKVSTDDIDDPENKVLYGQVNAVKAINTALKTNLSDYTNWYDILNEPYAKILIGLVLLVGVLKFWGWRSDSGGE